MLFNRANELESGGRKSIVRRRKASPKKGIVVRRDGQIVRDTIERKAVKVKPVKVRVDPSTIGGDCQDDWLNPVVRRKALGKRIHEEREQLLQVLRGGYRVSRADVELLCFNDLLTLFDAEKAKQAKSLELRKKAIKDKEERLGRFYNSFIIVSDIESVHNTEHYKMFKTERDEEDIVPSNCTISREEKERKDAEWAARKKVIQAKMEEEQFTRLAECDFTSAQIQAVVDGSVEQVVSIDAANRQKERNIKLEEFLAQGFPVEEANLRVTRIMGE